MSISGVIHTFNEERNIANAIRSLTPWVDEVVIIDMHSEDRTREIAVELGARVVLHERLQFADPARDFGVAQTRGDWVIGIDADEMVPSSLAARLLQVVKTDEADIVMIYTNAYIMGAPFSGGGWGLGQEFHSKFFRKGKVQFLSLVHSPHALATDARILKLAPKPELSLLHFNYIDAYHVLQKFNRYSSLEAEGRRSRNRPTSMLRAIYLSMRSFASRYFYHQGYRQGWRGLFMCAHMVMYEIAAFAKQKELEELASYGAPTQRYAKLAHELLAGYHNFDKPAPPA